MVDDVSSDHNRNGGPLDASFGVLSFEDATAWRRLRRRSQYTER